MTELRAPSAWHIAIRPARLADLPALVELERRVFPIDRLSRRSIRHLLTRANAVTLVETLAGELRGCAMLLFVRKRASARLYSFAVAPIHRGKGLAKALLAESERVALARGATYLRLEVRRDNLQARQLYRNFGYREAGIAADYYEDHMDAVRMVKTLRPDAGGPAGRGRRRDATGAP